MIISVFARFKNQFSFFRSDMMNLAKVLMATPAVMLLGIDFYRRIQEATNPQRQVTMVNDADILFLPYFT